MTAGKQNLIPWGHIQVSKIPDLLTDQIRIVQGFQGYEQKCWLYLFAILSSRWGKMVLGVSCFLVWAHFLQFTERQAGFIHKIKLLLASWNKLNTYLDKHRDKGQKGKSACIDICSGSECYLCYYQSPFRHEVTLQGKKTCQKSCQLFKILPLCVAPYQSLQAIRST